jgi:hypothetical protein
MCRLNINEPVEHDNLMLPPNFEFPVYEAMVEEDEEIPDEIRWVSTWNDPCCKNEILAYMVTSLTNEKFVLVPQSSCET